MDKKRGYNIKYLLLFTSAAALLWRSGCIYQH